MLSAQESKIWKDKLLERQDYMNANPLLWVTMQVFSTTKIVFQIEKKYYAINENAEKYLVDIIFQSFGEFESFDIKNLDLTAYKFMDF